MNERALELFTLTNIGKTLILNRPQQRFGIVHAKVWEKKEGPKDCLKSIRLFGGTSGELRQKILGFKGPLIVPVDVVNEIGNHDPEDTSRAKNSKTLFQQACSFLPPEVLQHVR
jgi:hypothetical protein